MASAEEVGREAGDSIMRRKYDAHTAPNWIGLGGIMKDVSTTVWKSLFLPRQKRTHTQF